MNSYWSYNGAESVTSIPNNDIVDWVLVSLRNEIEKSSTVERRAAFLINDGTIVDIDGTSALSFPVAPGNYYIVLEHRNHLSIMSSEKVNLYP
jgi:hypothetical protein